MKFLTLVALVVLFLGWQAGALARPANAQAQGGTLEVIVEEVGDRSRSAVPGGWLVIVPAQMAAEPVRFSDAAGRYAYQLGASGRLEAGGLAPGRYLVAFVGSATAVGAADATLTLVVDWSPTPLTLPARAVEVRAGERVSVTLAVRTPSINLPPGQVPTPPRLGSAGLRKESGGLEAGPMALAALLGAAAAAGAGLALRAGRRR